MYRSLLDDSLHTNKRQPYFQTGETQHQLLDCGIQEINMCRQDRLQKETSVHSVLGFTWSLVTLYIYIYCRHTRTMSALLCITW